MSLEELQQLEERWVIPTYARTPVAFVRGEGAYLWDAEGKRYLDFLAGISVCSTGHCHPSIVEAIRSQAGELIHTSNLFYTEPAMRLAERLAASSLGGKVFLCNSGAEANEFAIKLARKHAHSRGIDRPRIVVVEGAFHGRTMGALAATPQESKQAPFAPMLEGFDVVARDAPEALAAAVGPETAAVMLEPVQGESGIFPLSDEMLLAAREACERSGALLIFDEIQCGMGRTGSLWAYEQGSVRPDVMTVAKALGSGLPIGACVTGADFAEVMSPGDHGSTFAGGPIQCAAALATLELIDDADLLRSVRELGGLLNQGLESIRAVCEVRFRGLMFGVDVEGNTAEIQADLLEAGLVVNVPRPGTLRLLPPLTIGRDELAEALGILSRVL